MDHEVKKLWINALRSGEYEQGTGALNNNDEYFCCLGVLCELATEAGVVRKYYLSDQSGLYGYGNSQESAVLPPEVMKWAGISCSAARVPDAVDTFLTELNDSETTFKEIADIIERKF